MTCVQGLGHPSSLSPIRGIRPDRLGEAADTRSGGGRR